ncbi:MAG: hypothetical protein RMJ00_01600 [Nitrososphaerota archaeon]|nr:hypothetical protein [Nitrososphaerota archaeon]
MGSNPTPRIKGELSDYVRRIRLLIELVESLDKQLRRYRAMLFLKGIRRFDRELIEEGFSPEEIRRLCDICLRVIILKRGSIFWRRPVQ